MEQSVTTIELPAARHLVIIGHSQQRGSIAATPEISSRRGDRLDAEPAVATLHVPATEKSKVPVVLVEVVLLKALRQTADHDEAALLPCHAAGPVLDFGNVML